MSLDALIAEVIEALRKRADEGGVRGAAYRKAASLRSFRESRK
jgi:hypothetical protein